MSCSHPDLVKLGGFAIRKISILKSPQSAPGSTVKGGCSGSLIFTVLSAPPLPPVHRVRGGGEVCFQTPRKHRWASSLSSNYSEFFVESGSLRAASPGSPGTWYLLHLWKNAPRHSLLTAKSTFYRRECGYSIVVEVTCHFQTFSTEQDWTALAGELYKKPPDWLSWASDLGVAHPDLCWLGGPHY
jgi:hypothetical protein